MMQVVSLYENQSIGDIVRSDYRTADVFREYGINYCCNGNASLSDVCSQKNLPFTEVLNKLNQVSQSTSLPLDLQFHTWKTDFLIDYIINVHHAYLKRTLPQLETELRNFIDHHRNEYPELKNVLAMYSAICVLMMEEQRQQEEVVFPYIKQIYAAHRRREPYGGLFVRTMRKPMKFPGDGQEQLSEYLTTVRELTGNYSIPEGKCAGYDVLIHRLHELDSQLVLHKHLENNILFPAAQAMEQELLKA